MPSPSEPSARVRSVNIGRSEANPAKSVGVTGFRKLPVASAELRPPGPKVGGLGSGLVGDFIGHVASHGGDRQAVYAVAREELDQWEVRLGRSLADGGFGENLTVEGLDIDGGRVGDRWAIGDTVVLEVTGPRIPCATFAHRIGEPGWLKTFTAVGRTGAYLAIVEGGTVRPGDSVTLVERAAHDIGLVETFRAFMGDAQAAAVVLEAGLLPEDEADWLRERVRART